MTNEIIGYAVLDKQTGRTVRSYGPDQFRAANRKVDALDNAYGAYRYSVRPMYRAPRAEAA